MRKPTQVKTTISINHADGSSWKGEVGADVAPRRNPTVDEVDETLGRLRMGSIRG